MLKLVLRTSPITVVSCWLAGAIVLYITTHIPIPPPASEVVNRWDKVIHCAAYLVLAILSAFAFLDRQRLRIPAVALVLAMLAYAAFDEYTQGFVGRIPDVYDWCSDAVGIVLGIGMVSLLLRGARQSRSAHHEGSVEPV
ncbi:VanZ family protein [Planctomicrobium sp. SH664]|uniref:VanZ family protein n=1 Tax=Planctomicrobium sp. SH664 TaxID=3448125 RepID=UPI003F5B011E